MANNKKPRVEADAFYKVYIWYCKFVDLIWKPQRRVEKLPLKEGMAVVDYGCGTGRYTLPIARLVGSEGKVFAVDIHPLAISTVRKKAARESLTNIEAILVNSYNTGIQGSSIDLVLLVDTLHLIGDCDALFREIHRMLKQDGTLFMDPGHMKVSRAREIVEGTGIFAIAECRGQDMLVVPKAKQ